MWLSSSGVLPRSFHLLQTFSRVSPAWEASQRYIEVAFFSQNQSFFLELTSSSIWHGHDPFYLLPGPTSNSWNYIYIYCDSNNYENLEKLNFFKPSFIIRIVCLFQKPRWMLGWSHSSKNMLVDPLGFQVANLTFFQLAFTKKWKVCTSLKAIQISARGNSRVIFLQRDSTYIYYRHQIWIFGANAYFK